MKHSILKQYSYFNYSAPYKFSGKEKDEETSYSYFGARYYMSDVSVWLSVDPLWEERSWLSPYNYCQWNPVMLTDPTGMLDDGYTIDENGNTQRVDNTGGKNYDVLYNKKDYDSGKRDYDRSGTKNGIQLDRGQISNFTTAPATINNNEGEKTGETYRHSAEVKSQEVADKLFLFLDKNTQVEWSNQNYTDPSGKSVNLIATSHTGGEYPCVGGGRALTESYMKRGYKLNKDDHNHPWNFKNGGKVSGYYGETVGWGSADKGTQQMLQNFQNKNGDMPGKDAKFRMLWRGKFTNY